MKKIQFTKMHGLENDFVVIDARTQPLDLSAEEIALITDRHRGVGCDQLVLLELSEQVDVRVRFFNPDGSESSACGNATRCVAYRMMQEKSVTQVALETGAGVLHCEAQGERLVSVQMGKAMRRWDDIPLSQNVDTLHLPIRCGEYPPPAALSMGNPHVVFLVEDVQSVPLEILGPELETHELFPERTNVEFAQVLDANRLRLRVWERGAGETRACGSGACAASVAAILQEQCQSPVEVELPGGQLSIAVDEALNVVMTGPVAEVFSGEIVL